MKKRDTFPGWLKASPVVKGKESDYRGKAITMLEIIGLGYVSVRRVVQVQCCVGGELQIPTQILGLGATSILHPRARYTCDLRPSQKQKGYRFRASMFRNWRAHVPVNLDTSA